MKPISNRFSVNLIKAGLYEDATPREIIALTSPSISFRDMRMDVKRRIIVARKYFHSIGKYEGEIGEYSPMHDVFYQ